MAEKKKETKSKKEQLSTKLPVYDLEGKVVDNIQLDEKLFDGHVNMVLLYEVKKMYEANIRRGTASTKTRAEISGGGSKPWRQKGTGRARFGSSRNPLWRHGGTIFGPKPRDFGYSMPKKAMRKALLSSLNARLLEQMIKAVVKIELIDPKTREFRGILKKLKTEGRTLVVVDSITEGLKRSSRNLKHVNLKEGKSINARDVLLNESLVIEKEALEKVVERLK
ncbi:MAG: 50S ribosomal protein L4 [Candidatus Omnitrophota bacterium]|nr:50S ribosomal protein L4 [Candidatus Omnitrophota bacterium]